MDPDTPDLASLRAEYQLAGLEEADLAPDPYAMFRGWFEGARAAGVLEPNAMVLSSVSVDGQPSSRTVLLKGLTDLGFVFFTNYESRKGRDLADNPAVALLFGWYPLQRQIRVEGDAAQVTREETESYFATRPRDSQLGAWASPQSDEVGSRADLDAAYAAAVERFGDGPILCPPHWGGYRVLPSSVEFWQGRPGRLHDRLRYRHSPDTQWLVERLAP